MATKLHLSQLTPRALASTNRTRRAGGGVNLKGAGAVWRRPGVLTLPVPRLSLWLRAWIVFPAWMFHVTAALAYGVVAGVLFFFLAPVVWHALLSFSGPTPLQVDTRVFTPSPPPVLHGSADIDTIFTDHNQAPFVRLLSLAVGSLGVLGVIFGYMASGIIAALGGFLTFFTY